MASRCQEFRAQLAESISRPLAGADQENLDRHLSGCPGCRDHHQALLEDHRLLESFARSIGARQERMEEKVMATVSKYQGAGLEVDFKARPASHRLARWAVAAVLLLAIVGGLTLLDRGPATSVAWAQVIARVEAAQDYICRVERRSSISPDMEIIQYCSAQYGVRQDMFVDGRHVADTHINPATGEMVVLIHRDRKFSRLAMPPRELARVLKSSSSAEFVRGFKDLGFREIGLKEIEGRTASGIETEAREIWGGVFDEGRLRLWVDVETRWPVRVEFEGKAAGGARVRSVYDRMQWNATLAPGDFAFEIPAGYASLGEVDYREVNQETAIEGLRAYAALTGGRYPGRLVFASTVREFEKLEPELRRRGLMDDESLPRLLSIQQACMFFEELRTQDRAPVYHGETVTARDFDRVLLAWRLDDGNFRVVLGDLRVQDLTGQELDVLLEP
jgi:hypothetical protein